MKTFFYRLFGFGKIREPLASELKNEGIIAADEGVRASLTYKNFRSPGRRSDWRRVWFSGAVALSKKRLVLQKYSQPVVNLDLADERFQKITVSVESENVLLFEFEPQLFLENSSGSIEWRFRTPQAQTFADAIVKMK